MFDIDTSQWTCIQESTMTTTTTTTTVMMGEGGVGRVGGTLPSAWVRVGVGSSTQ